MPGGRFGRRHRDTLLHTKQRLDRRQLPEIANRRRGCVGIQMLHLLRRNTGLRQGQRHRAASATAVLGTCRQVVSIGARAITNQFRQRLSAPGQGMFQGLNHQQASPFTHDKAVTTTVERA
ncbi:hypothetical protein D3C85_924870 [compost metagenome]